MRLGIYQFIEGRLMDRRLPARTNLHGSVLDYSQVEVIDKDLAMEVDSLFDVRLTIGARVKRREGTSKYEVVERASKMMVHALLSDLDKEIQEVRDWCYKEGITLEVDDKLERLQKLIAGENV